MWAASHVPQCISTWKSKDPSSFNFLSLIFQIGASALIFIYASLTGSALLALFAVWNAACLSLYVWVYVKYPPSSSEDHASGAIMYSVAGDDSDDGL